MLHLRGYATERVALTPEQAAALAALTRRALTEEDSDAPRVLQAVSPTPVSGHYDVTPGPYVGRLAVAPGLVLDLASQFPFRDLLAVIAVAARLPALPTGEPVPLSAGTGLVDVVAREYAREVEHLVGVGLAKAYVERQFSRPPYPGIPDAPAHLARLAGRPDRLVTKARRLTTDTEGNQVLAAALDVLLGQVVDISATRERLRALRPVFAGVTRLPRRAALARVRTTSAPARYRRALGLAGIVLAGKSLVADEPDQRGPSLLFSMPAVWEAYLAAVLRRALPTGHRLDAQRQIPLTDTGAPITARADLVEVGPTGGPVRVLDAKYKALPAKPSAGDLYQMVAYAQRLHVHEAVLLHPGRGEITELTVGSLHVVVRGVDVLLSRTHETP